MGSSLPGKEAMAKDRQGGGLCPILPFPVPAKATGTEDRVLVLWGNRNTNQQNPIMYQGEVSGGEGRPAIL